MTATGGEQTVKGFKAAAIEEAQNTAIATVVVSIDGSPDDILNRVLEMKLEDYEAVLAAIEEVTAGKKKALNTELALAQFYPRQTYGRHAHARNLERYGWDYSTYHESACLAA